ncbi:MAG TPA: hypothetical protein VNA12_03985 [Mycobacteriales bacterium]|nr:hypothetical protein [Mycobacteriales bacterium]
MRGLRTAVATVAVATLAACGSTAAPAPRAVDGVPGRLSADAEGLTAPTSGPSGDGSAGPPAGLAPGSTHPPDSSSGGSTATGRFGAGSGSSGAGSSGGGAPGGSRGTSSGAVRHGVGVTAKEIFIGIGYTTDAEQANRALGVEVSQGDTKANAEAIIADINERGGVAGRKLVPVFHAYEAQSAQTGAQQDQAACSRYTEDNKVFAVMGDGYSDTLRACLLKAGVLQVVGGQLYAAERETFDANPQMFNLGAPMQDRWFKALTPALVRLGYFGGWDTAAGAPAPGKANVGVLAFDQPMWTKPVPRVLLPALAAAGHPVAPDNVVYIHAPESNAEIGAAAAEIQNAVLRFQQNRVTHVVLLDTTGGLTLLFASAARNQQYYPRYGVGTTSGLQALYDLGALTDREVNGAAGVGWDPYIDLPTADSERFANAKSRSCMELLKRRTGQEYGSTNEASIALSQCDELYTTVDAVRGIVGSIDLRSAKASLESLGSFQLASVPRVSFSRAKHDGPAEFSDLVWDTPCTCVKYVGPRRAFPQLD